MGWRNITNFNPSLPLGKCKPNSILFLLPGQIWGIGFSFSTPPFHLILIVEVFMFPKWVYARLLS